MKKILLCLAESFLWLFESYDFWIFDSHWEPGFGGQAMIALSNGSIQIRFLTDRDQVYLEFSPIHSIWPDDEVVTIDLLYARIVGGFIDTAMVDSQTAGFLKAHFDDILALFSDSNVNDLITEFKKLKKERARNLFG